MIKLICTDFDGVLFDGCDMHFEVLNRAIFEVAGEKYVINREQHERAFNGLPTKRKLEILTESKDLDPELHYEINKRKQLFTNDYIETNIKPCDKLIKIFENIPKDIKLYCVSNAIKNTVVAGLKCLNIYNYFNEIISNEDVKRPKPSPEPYLTAIIRAGASVFNTLIFEDSDVGVQSARDSGAKVIKVKDHQMFLDEAESYINLYCRT
jgi:beta-phosphoglucomutase